MYAYVALLVVVAAQRIGELALSRHNIAWARARGGVETGRGHYGFMVLLHAAFLPACVLEVWLLQRPFVPWLGVTMLVVLAATQLLRYWAIVTLGRRWNVRIMVLPGAPAVLEGPYRWIRHPNYLAVMLEGLAIPLIHSAWLTAATFTLLNLPLLAVRIRQEEAALVQQGDYGPMSGRPRFLPRGGPSEAS